MNVQFIKNSGILKFNFYPVKDHIWTKYQMCILDKIIFCQNLNSQQGGKIWNSHLVIDF